MESKDDDELALLIATLPSSLLIGVAFIEGHSKLNNKYQLMSFRVSRVLEQK